MPTKFESTSLSGQVYFRTKLENISLSARCKEDMIMTYEEVFQQFKDRFKDTDVSKVKENLAYQFNITGEGAGSFYVEVKNGELFIEPYEYYDRDSLFICSAKTLFQIVDGKTDPIAAFTLGKLKVEGSVEKALRIKDLI